MNRYRLLKINKFLTEYNKIFRLKIKAVNEYHHKSFNQITKKNFLMEVIFLRKKYRGIL